MVNKLSRKHNDLRKILWPTLQSLCNKARDRQEVLSFEIIAFFSFVGSRRNNSNNRSNGNYMNFMNGDTGYLTVQDLATTQ